LKTSNQANINEIKVASNSSVKAVAGSITKSFEEGKGVEMSAIGAGAVNQAVKAMAMARGFLSLKGRDLYTAPGFDTVEIEGSEKTAIKFVLKLM
jgi:stage V sporulation protein S